MRAALDPDVAVAGRARAQIKVPQSDRVRLSTRLDPIMAAPEIPTPMIGPLLELGQEWLLPGIADVPPNTVAIVEPNSAFIEAYMVGLNHEMGRELLWRGFPTDQRGTVFARSGIARGSVATPTAPVPDRDIPPIHQWGPDSADRARQRTSTRRAQDLVVLLVRGDLLQRYPRATIYVAAGAVAARPARRRIVFDGRPRPAGARAAAGRATRGSSDARFPSSAASAGADITFLGFPLPKEEVRGIDRGEAPAAIDRRPRPGWYVVVRGAADRAALRRR